MAAWFKFAGAGRRAATICYSLVFVLAAFAIAGLSFPQLLMGSGALAAVTVGDPAIHGMNPPGSHRA